MTRWTICQGIRPGRLDFDFWMKIQAGGNYELLLIYFFYKLNYLFGIKLLQEIQEL